MGSQAEKYTGSQMMTRMMVHLMWMVELLERRYGNKQDWGITGFLGGLIAQRS
jgi:hypothetical protein